MAYPDPTQPIIINISVSATAQADTRLRTFAVVSVGDTSLSAGETKFVSASDFNQTVTNTSSTTYKFLTTFFNQENNQNKQCLIVELTSAGTAQSQIQALQKYLGEGINLAYGYYLPQKLWADSNITAFLANYNGVSDSFYFFFDMENKLPSTSTIWTTNINGAKCVFGTFPNASSADVIPSAAVMGIMNSTSYDISRSNPMSDLNRKLCSGVSAVAPTSTMKNGIVQAPSSFFNNRGSSTYLMGGRMADGTPWTTRYSWDNTISRVNSAVETAFINSSNISGTAITFDNHGIATLAQIIINELNNCVSLGYLSSFGKGKDPVSGAIITPGAIDAVDVATWESQNPTEYANSVYGGFSAYLKVGTFIQQVVFNVTMG